MGPKNTKPCKHHVHSHTGALGILSEAEGGGNMLSLISSGNMSDNTCKTVICAFEV